MACGRDNIKTGDLLAWSRYRESKSSLWLNVVRFGTMSEYGHVSVAWRKGDQLFHVEATSPRIRVTSIPLDESFYYVPMSRQFPGEVDMSFFMDKVGLKYSFFDAVRAFLGLSVKQDDRWQCAELSNAFYRHSGLQISESAVTPSRMVQAAMSTCDQPLIKVSAKVSKGVTHGE